MEGCIEQAGVDERDGGFRVQHRRGDQIAGGKRSGGSLGGVRQLVFRTLQQSRDCLVAAAVCVERDHGAIVIETLRADPRRENREAEGRKDQRVFRGHWKARLCSDLDRQVRCLPGCDPAGNLADTIETVPLKNARGNRGPIAARAVDEERPIGRQLGQSLTFQTNFLVG